MNALLLSAILGVVMMLIGISVKKQSVIKTIAIAGMAVLFVANWLELKNYEMFRFNVDGFMAFNSFNLLFIAVILFATLLFFFLSSGEMQKIGKYYADYFALIFFITCGVILVASFQNLLILFLGIEIMTIPSYILAGTDKRNLKSNEAALKYLLLGSFSTGIMLLGIAFIYGSQGTFDIDQMKMTFLGEAKTSHLQIAGMFFLLFAMAFKTSVAPFHFWAPDVYEGSPTVFTSYMATIVKTAAFVGFYHLFESAFAKLDPVWMLWIGVLIALTLLIGNITATFQQSVKRMLAYSSISHAGFMLFSVFAMNGEGLFIYAAGYTLATMGIFAVITKMSDYSYEGFNGLAKHQPLLAFAATVCLLSLAGIPLTVGFLGKFYMLKAAMLTGKMIWLIVFAVIMAAVSAYYYFRVIQAMYFKTGTDNSAGITLSEKYALIIICILIILLGIFPNVLMVNLYF
jgi:NADH-quinone oxidoreductase subunit N